MADPVQAVYPASGSVYLLSENQRLNQNIAGLIDVLVSKDQQIAKLEAELVSLKGPPAPPADAPIISGVPSPLTTVLGIRG
jgi:hypothetical protein